MERALKKAILHRKNSLFYKTRKGAQMGDLFMSLIHTCELNDVNAFDYLTDESAHPAWPTLLIRNGPPPRVDLPAHPAVYRFLPPDWEQSLATRLRDEAGGNLIRW